MQRLIWIMPGLLLGLIFFLPLSWVAPLALPASLVQDNTVYRGTVWNGNMTSLRDVDSVEYKLNPLGLLAGGTPVQASVVATGLQAEGAIGQYAAEDLNFRIDVSSLPMPDPRLQGLAGQVMVQFDEIKWDKQGKCEILSGSARTDVLTRNRALFSWEGPGLTGPLNCDADGNFVFNLAGEDDLQSITAKVSISWDGQYYSDMKVISRDSDAAQVLPLFGFEERGQTAQGAEFRLVEQGKWR